MLILLEKKIENKKYLLPLLYRKTKTMVSDYHTCYHYHYHYYQWHHQLFVRKLEIFIAMYFLLKLEMYLRQYFFVCIICVFEIHKKI